MRLNLTKYYSEINNLLKIDNNIKKKSHKQLTCLKNVMLKEEE